MQPEVQTTTRGSLAVSASALEIAIVIQGALEVFRFTFIFYLYNYVVLLSTNKILIIIILIIIIIIIYSAQQLP